MRLDNGVISSEASSPLCLAQAPDIVTLTDAIVMPTVADPAHRSFSGCVYGRNGRVLRMSQRITGFDFAARDPDVAVAPSDARVLRGRAVWLGQYANHYGHFLLESLSRTWAIDSLPPAEHYVFNRFVTVNPPAMAPFQSACFQALGIDARRIVVIDKPVRCELLHVPTPLFRIVSGARPEYIETFRRIASFVTGDKGVDSAGRAPGGRYYLSRRRLRVVSRGTLNEDEVESTFADFGFEVIAPERLDWRQQILRYVNAGALAGFTGSALHNVLFSRPGTRLIDLADPRAVPQQNINQRCCNWLADADSSYLPFHGDRTKQGGVDVGRYDIGWLREQLAALIQDGCA
jgi:capsular polysaccharide biosynthesis protein